MPWTDAARRQYARPAGRYATDLTDAAEWALVAPHLPARAAARGGLRLEIVARAPGARGCAVLPRRWVVERTFAWLGRNRRLAKDVEATIASAVTMVPLASLQLLVRRLAKA